MSDELKPCPFCGGEAKVYDTEYERDVYDPVSLGYIDTVVDTVWSCACESCMAIVCEYKTKEEAVATWNTRVAVTDEQFAMAVHDGRAWQVVRECGCHPEHDGENFTTECGAMFLWEPPTPPHCPFCGGRVKVVG